MAATGGDRSEGLTPRASLESLASRLSARPPNGDALHAAVDGIAVVVRYVLRSAGSSSSKWTEIGVRSEDVKSGTPVRFDIDVWPASGHELSDVRAGRLRDLVLGDAAFDEAFVVEAAPQDVIRLLFDETSRKEMVALQPIRVFSTKEFAIEIDREGWVDDVDVLERFARLAVRLAAAIGPAAREAAEARRGEPHAGGYRDGPLTQDDIDRDRDADLRALDEQRRARRRRDGRIVLTIVIGVLVGITAITATIAVLTAH